MSDGYFRAANHALLESFDAFGGISHQLRDRAAPAEHERRRKNPTHCCDLLHEERTKL
jgi:hypothetical protein